ncbi:MAG: hypothetical protein LBB98_10765 [Treponema sp.]|jgi:hypothetical protein|nr:hypothetical protein [Treponema sp.]
MNNRKQKNRPAGAAIKTAKKAVTVKSSIPESAVYTSAVSALKAEAVLNGSARLTVFYTDGKATGYTTGHSNSRRAAGDGNGS